MTKTTPTFFNHITDEELRLSLIEDHREIEAALTASCWKTVMVMAGSIIEAVLIDYLLSLHPYDAAKQEAVLKYDLGKAVDECKTGGILSEKTAQLCIVVKGFRNLIHPGRVKRLKEKI